MNASSSDCGMFGTDTIETNACARRARRARRCSRAVKKWTGPQMG